LSFAIADGIHPATTTATTSSAASCVAPTLRTYAGLHQPFFYKLVDVLAETMGEVFPEIRTKQKIVQETIQREEEAFNKTLDKGIELFNDIISYEETLDYNLTQIRAEVASWIKFLAT